MCECAPTRCQRSRRRGVGLTYALHLGDVPQLGCPCCDLGCLYVAMTVSECDETNVEPYHFPSFCTRDASICLVQTTDAFLLSLPRRHVESFAHPRRLSVARLPRVAFARLRRPHDPGDHRLLRHRRHRIQNLQTHHTRDPSPPPSPQRPPLQRQTHPRPHHRPAQKRWSKRHGTYHGAVSRWGTSTADSDCGFRADGAGAV